MEVALKNEAGVIRRVKVGFSWTAFFFGPFPFFFRGMPIHGVMWFFAAIFTLGISNLILMFIINRQTAQYYLDNGYKPYGSGWDVAGQRWGLETFHSSKVITNKTGSAPQHQIRRVLHFYIAGAVAGLLQSLLLIAVNEIGVTELLLGFKFNFGALVVWLVYPRMTWGGLWALFFLLPLLTTWPHWLRGPLVGMLPTLATWFYFNPREGHGMLGLGLSDWMPLFVLFFNVLWGLLAGLALDLSHARRTQEAPTEE